MVHARCPVRLLEIVLVIRVQTEEQGRQVVAALQRGGVQAAHRVIPQVQQGILQVPLAIPQVQQGILPVPQETQPVMAGDHPRLKGAERREINAVEHVPMKGKCVLQRMQEVPLPR